jgi:hypothetical protein
MPPIFPKVPQKWVIADDFRQKLEQFLAGQKVGPLFGPFSVSINFINDGESSYDTGTFPVFGNVTTGWFNLVASGASF